MIQFTVDQVVPLESIEFRSKQSFARLGTENSRKRDKQKVLNEENSNSAIKELQKRGSVRGGGGVNFCPPLVGSPVGVDDDDGGKRNGLEGWGRISDSHTANVG